MPAIALLLLLGLALRFGIAYVLFPGSGFATDLGSFTAWSMTLATHGPGGFYDNAGFADYPPGYLYVLWLVGLLSHLLAPLAEGSAAAVASGLIKMPPMLADIAIGGLLFWLVRSWAGPRHDAERLGLLAAGLYVFNPVTWYDSALWGQTDAIGALVLLLAVAALVRGNSEGAAALTVLAALVKPQFGVVLVPIVGAVLLRRHLFAPGSGPQHTPRGPAAVRAWLEQERGPWRLVSSATAGMIVMLALLVPFRLDIFGFIELMAGTAGGYPWLSVNAYNIWALVGADGRLPLADGGGWSPDTVPLLGPLPGVVIGAALLAGSFALVGLRLLWREDRRTIIVAGIVVALAFFLLPTRVHERYMFPIFALLPLLAAVDRRWLWATVALSAAAFINLHMVLTNPLYATDNVANLPLGELFRQPIGAYASVILHVAGFVFAAFQLRPRLAAEPDPFSAPLPPVAERDAWDEALEPLAVATAARPRAARASAAATEVERSPVAERWIVMRQRLQRLVAVVALRRDRSASLVAERGGRIDRLDVLILLLVFISTLGLRTVNLGQPHGMHFDEVYHARTGTEFLQHWRYGMPHSIYEWTHPHLAKYAMAAGVDVLGNNRVVATADLGAPINGATLERRWDESGDLRRGDRAYLLTPSEVRVVDLATQRQVATLPVAADGADFAAAVVDDGTHTLYLVDFGGGLWQLPTGTLDALHADPGAATEIALQPLGQLDLPRQPRALFVAHGRLALTTGDDVVVVDPETGSEVGRASVPGAATVIGVAHDEGDALAVGAAAGIVLLDAATVEEMRTFTTAAPVTGMAVGEQGVDRPTIYAATGSLVQLLRAPGSEEPTLGEQITMPAPVRDVIVNQSAALIHVLGATPDGTGTTLYAVEPHSNAVFTDAVLPFDPLALVMDIQPRRPAEDRLNALTFSAAGEQATIDVGSNSFGWRFPGVLAGALMAVAIYLLARMLFARRTVAVLAALLVLADGMMFSNARIAMNDTYVALFIVAAFALFAPLYMGRWRSPPAVAAAVLGVGLLLGLALASKWVGLYALGAIVLLILLRSALGRLLALGAMVVMTAVLGYVAVASGPETTQLNFLFLGLMVGLTAALAVGITVRPVRMSIEELRLAVYGPAVAGALALLAALGWALAGPAVGADAPLTPGRLIALGVGLLLLSPIVYAAARLAPQLGLPLPVGVAGVASPPSSAEPAVTADEPAAAGAPPTTTDEQAADPPAAAWLRPGAGPLGLPWLATLGTLALVPLIIYVLSYAPWVELGNRWWADFPAGHTGQTFLDLQRGMYDYHNHLRATHAASSPWWAWPLDLKPVWFYQRDYAGGTTGTIYNTGNMVIFWLAVPAVAFAAYQAWRRRSLALTLLVIAVACLWLPWARIDRVAFQYHIFTTLPFAFLCLAYFLAELWHGASRRTWLFARLAAALAILLPVLLWVVRLPLCAVARVGQVNPNAEICQADLLRLPFVNQLQGPIVVGIVVIVALLAITPLFAYFVLRARDARRFVVGALVAAVAWFVLWYPNFSGLPVPGPLSQIHLGLLPTLNHSFQFGANTDPPAVGATNWAGMMMLLVIVSMVVAAAVYAARSWRAARPEPRPLTTAHEAG